MCERENLPGQWLDVRYCVQKAQRRFDPKLYLVPSPQNRVLPTKNKHLVISNEDQKYMFGAHAGARMVTYEQHCWQDRSESNQS
jgi:hypothetical protein